MNDFKEGTDSRDVPFKEQNSSYGTRRFDAREDANTENSNNENLFEWTVEHKEVALSKRSNVVSVFDVAVYIMQKLKKCTTMKLQKLLYYCQAWYLVWNEEPLFEERIEAWANGPVVRALYQFHKGLYVITLSDMSVGNPEKLTESQKKDIDSVLDAYGDKNSQWLVEQTHAEEPWKNARKGMTQNERGSIEITHQAMAEYYSSLHD